MARVTERIWGKLFWLTQGIVLPKKIAMFMRCFIEWSRRGLFGLLLILEMGLGSCDAQGLAAGTPSVVLEADGSQWLHSASIDLERPVSGGERLFECRFGFSTQEMFHEGLLADMLSAVLLDATGQRSMVLFTLSAEGLSLMPQTADSLTVDLERVILEEIAPPVSEVGFSTRFAYRLQTPLPNSFAPGKVRLAMALYDNQDEAASRAWLDEITVVPEPAGLWIVALASSALYCLRIRRLD